MLGTYFSLLYSEICQETNSLIFHIQSHDNRFDHHDRCDTHLILAM